MWKFILISTRFLMNILSQFSYSKNLLRRLNIQSTFNIIIYYKSDLFLKVFLSLISQFILKFNIWRPLYFLIQVNKLWMMTRLESRTATIIVRSVSPAKDILHEAIVSISPLHFRNDFILNFWSSTAGLCNQQNFNRFWW